MNIEEIKASGKEAIVQMAYKIIGDKYPQIDLPAAQYEIKVWANSVQVLVKFRRLIRFVPLNKEVSDFTYDLSVNLITGEVFPLDIWREDNFFVLSEVDKKKYNFVLANFGLPVKHFQNTIYEKEDAYNISLKNKVAFGRYFIDKVTGKEKDSSMQGSYVPMPPPLTPKEEVQDPLEEIKE